MYPSCSLSTRGRLASVGPIAGGTIALAAACALAASAVLAAPLEPVAVVVLPLPAPMPSHGSTELANRIDSAPGLVVAGEPLNARLLRRFYAAHGFEPVWKTRQAQANSLLSAVLHAADHGIAPELFH